MFLFLVSHDVNHNTYHWLRPPHIQKDINLDNHEVDIKEYNFSYVLDGKCVIYLLFHMGDSILRSK